MKATLSALLLCLAAQTLPVHAQEKGCSAPLETALRLMLVTTYSMETFSARIQYFKRTTTQANWQPMGIAEDAVIGKAGLGWGSTFLRFRADGEPEKKEGDKRTPAGVFRLGPRFGFSQLNEPNYIWVKEGETGCVEDPRSSHYNTIINRSEVGASIRIDEMRRTPLYRHGLFVDYPTDRSNRRGSCIFVHIWAASDEGTAGCIALPEQRVRAAQEFARHGAVIAILAEHHFERFSGCLPTEIQREMRGRLGKPKP